MLYHSIRAGSFLMDQQPTYRHTQPARLIWLVLAIAMIILIAAAIIAGFSVLTMIVIGGILILLTGWLLRSLTVSIGGGMLSWWFGPGFWRKRVSLAEIEDCEAVRNRWWWGFGIRYYGKGFLYNVSGLDAVEFRLASGKYFRVGTDEPEALAAAVKASIPFDGQ
jgi:Zn-dependent protease with chaperone function